MKITDIIPSEYNPRKISPEEYTKLANSIQEFGFVDPIIINLNNNHIIGGHQRYEFLLNQYVQNKEYSTLKLLKLGDIGWIFPETELTVENEDYEKALNIALNKISGEWDNDKLNELFQDLKLNDFDLDLTGFDNIELEELNFEVTDEDILNDTLDVVDDEYVPEDDLTVTVERGDLYRLGNHYLMCGDSTNSDDVDKLMQGHKADISFTSPPYNAGTTPTEAHMGISSKYKHDDDNKTTEEYTKFLNDYLANAIKHSKYTFMNIQSLSNNKVSLIETLHDNKEYFADTIIWDKMAGQPAMAKNVLNSVFEYIHIFSERATRTIGTIEFRGTLENIVHIPLQRSNEYCKIHNATFSIDFVSYFVKHFAKDSVLDLFGGTGTTLIACEQLGRVCYMMEYDPYYCQVVLDRFRRFTGCDAVKL